jgi:hypothetical protein
MLGSLMIANTAAWLSSVQSIYASPPQGQKPLADMRWMATIETGPKGQLALVLGIHCVQLLCGL